VRWGVGLGLLAAILCAVAAPAASAAPAWLAPQDLSAAGQSAYEPQVAVDPEGDSTAVWERSDGSNEIVQASTRRAGGTWSAPVDLSEEGLDSYEPQVAVDAAGDVTVVWNAGPDSSHRVVQASTRRPGGAWSAPVDLSEEVGNADWPRIAVDPDGDATAVWESFEGGNSVVQASTRPAGGTWSAPVSLSAGGQEAREPEVAMDPEGAATAVWRYEYESAHFVIQGSTSSPGGAWSVPADLSEEAGSASEPSVAVDSSGGATAVWRRPTGIYNVVESSTRPAGGSWSSPVELSEAGQNASYADIAVAPGGNATAVWCRFDGIDSIAQSSSRPVDGSWSEPVDLSEAGQSAYETEIAVGPGGSAIAAWSRFDGSFRIVQSATRRAGGAWSDPADLSEEGEDAFEPDLAFDSQGDATAVWYRGNGSDEIVQAAGYDAAGPQLRSLSIPAAGTAGQPVYFSVSPLDVWSVVAGTSWTFGDGGAAGGAAVSHVYAAPGTYPVTVTGTDALGSSTSAAGSIAIAAAPVAPQRRVPDWVRFAGLRRNLRNGTAVLYVRVPAAGRLVLYGRGVLPLHRVAERAKRVPLPIKPRRPLRRYLRHHRRARIRVEVAFEPQDGSKAKSIERVVVLKRRHHPR
jgi:PKD domain